jgi:magnesium chelatase family protein
VEVAAVSPTDLALPSAGEHSATVAARVAQARTVQKARYVGEGRGVAIRTNAEADGALLERVAAPDAAGRALLTAAVERMGLTARGYHRVLRVARTLADLEGVPAVRCIHIAEALSYRPMASARNAAESSRHTAATIQR